MKVLKFTKFWIIAIVLAFWSSNVNAQSTLVVSEAEIVDALTNEFVENGMHDDIEFEFFGGRTSFIIKDASFAKIMISNLRFDYEKYKFWANAEIFADGEKFEETSLFGQYYFMTSVVVPKQYLDNGSQLNNEDFKEIGIRSLSE